MRADDKIWFPVSVMVSAYLVSAISFFIFCMNSEYKSLLVGEDGFPIFDIF